MNKLRICHLFAGVGAPEMALDKLNIEYDNVGYSEIDKLKETIINEINGVNNNESNDTSIK